MAPSSFLEPVRRWLQKPVDVGLVCEITAGYVVAARGSQGKVDAWALETLPEGVVRPAPLAENVADTEVLDQALGRAVSQVADGQRRCVLLVPDLLARTTVLEFDEMPERETQADELLRWRLKKELPFDVAQAALSYHAQSGPGAAREVLVTACLRELLRQYEAAAERQGLEPGWVTLSTLAALGCLEPEVQEARLLVKRDAGSLSLAVTHGGEVRFFRSLPLAAGTQAVDDQTLFDKIYPAAVYFQDQWKQTLSQILFVGGGPAPEGLVRRLEQETGAAVVELNLVGMDLPAASPAGLPADHRLVPSLGWVRGELA